MTTHVCRDPEKVMLLLLLHLMSDVTHLEISADTGSAHSSCLQLDQHHCETLLQELHTVTQLSLQTIQLENLDMQDDLLSWLFQLSPHLGFVKVTYF